MAGGTDLLVQLRSGRCDLDVLMDIKQIPEMNSLLFDNEKGLTLGASIPCYRIYEDDLIKKMYPALADSASLIGGVAVQGRATIGGNVCNSAPSGDFLPTLIILGASCRIMGPNEERTIPVEHFFIDPGSNVLEPDELLVDLHIPPPPPHSGAHYLRFIPRNEMDIAVVGVGAMIVLSDDFQKILSARIALGAVAPTPVPAKEACDFLIGKSPGDEAFGRAAELAKKAARPISDMRATETYRRHLVGVLTMRALKKALEKARRNEEEVQNA
jgi:carbon-monoxide dehydrogenase medium subunit